MVKNLFGNIIKILGTCTFFLILAILFTTLGYKVANQETLVAQIEIVPKNGQEFVANINWLDGGKPEMYKINGDQFYIDAKILKWKGWLSYLGVRTWYEFDRIGGRYVSIEDERSKSRSVYQLAERKDYDLYSVRKQYPILSVLLDAEYGSAAFFLADMPKKVELSIARSGLTLRVLDGDQQPKIKIN